MLATSKFHHCDAIALEYTPSIRDAFRILASGWISTSKQVDQWIAKIEKLHFSVDNKNEFLRCRELLLEWLEEDSWLQMSQEGQASLENEW